MPSATPVFASVAQLVMTGALSETLACTLAQEDAGHKVLSHLAKYVVVVVGEPMVSGVFVPTRDPPQLSRYQRSVVPDPPFATSVIVPEPGHAVDEVTDTEVGAVTVGLKTQPEVGSHKSTVQGSLSLQSMGVWVHPPTASQLSMVQALPSSQPGTLQRAQF